MGVHDSNFDLPVSDARGFERPGDISLDISIVTWGELCFAAAKRNDPGRAHSLLEQFSRVVEVLSLQASAGSHYGDPRAVLRKAGTPIGSNDLWIAAHALSLGVPLVGNNLRELERVPRLKLENRV